MRTHQKRNIYLTWPCVLDKKKQFKSCVCVWIESMYHKIWEQDAGIYLLQCICSLAPVTCFLVVQLLEALPQYESLRCPEDHLLEARWSSRGLKCPEVTLKACQSSFIKLNHVLMPPGWSWRTALWRWWWLIFHRKCVFMPVKLSRILVDRCNWKKEKLYTDTHTHTQIIANGKMCLQIVW